LTNKNKCGIIYTQKKRRKEMWIQDLQKAVNILVERGHNDILFNKIVPSGSGEILAIFYTTYYTPIEVYKNGLITEYDLINGEGE
jgi:hypothetical protein